MSLPTHPPKAEGSAMPLRTSRPPRCRLVLFAVGLLVSAGLTERRAHAQARQDVEAGRQDEADKDYGGAWLRFSRAYEATHEPMLLVEMAACEKGNQQYAQAARHVEQALASKPGLTATDAARAHELYNALLPSLGHIRVAIDPAGADVTVDDAAVGQAPLEGDVLIDPGEHRLRVTKAGYVEFTTMVSAAGGTQKLLDVKLQPVTVDGRVRIHTAPKNTVVLDGVIGYGNWDGRVAAGPHSLRISAPGMRSFEPDLVVAPNKTSTFDVTLQPDTGGPVGLWIAGGAVVVATVVVAVLSVFHPEPAPAPH